MKKYLICIDSDGCAIDSMEIKHRRCFGPCLIDVWNLEIWKSPILERWNEINLYSMTRGINRFLGLEKILTEVNDNYVEIEGLEQYCRWCETTTTFSNAAVEAEIQMGNHLIFEQVLQWSREVNQKVEEISGEIRPFKNVKNALEEMCSCADIAIVSSANPKAVRNEWTRFGFLEYVNYVMAQDSGTKVDCIHRMIEQGYRNERILVLGDAPGDEQAAAKNGVHYYPILAGREVDSWNRLVTEALPRLFSGTYSEDYQQMLIEQFHHNLSGENFRPRSLYRVEIKKHNPKQYACQCQSKSESGIEYSYENIWGESGIAKPNSSAHHNGHNHV